MSDDFTRKNDDFSNPYAQPAEPYRGDPWAEQRALGEKKSGCGGCAWGCGCGCLILILFLVIAGAIVYFQCIKGVPLKPSPETTVLTEPLKSDGKTIDYFKAIQGEEPKIPADENGFKSVLAAYGKVMFKAEFGPDRDWQYDETCKALGLDPAAPSTAVFEEPNEYVTISKEIAAIKTEEDAEKEADEDGKEELKEEIKEKAAEEAAGDFDRHIKTMLTVTGLAGAPWKSEDQPKMKEWLDKVGPGLDVLQKAAMKEHYFAPMVRRDENDLCFLAFSPNVTRFHGKLSRALRIRAMGRLGAGDAEEGWKDMLAALRLSRFLYEAPNSQAFGNMMAMSAENGPTAQAFLRYEKWTPAQFDARIAELETLPRIVDRKRRLERLRFTVLDAVVAAGDVSKFLGMINEEPVDPTMGKMFSAFGFDWNILTSRFNRQFDEFEAKLADKDVDKLLKLFDRHGEEGFDTEMSNLSDEEKGRLVMSMLTVTGRSEKIGELGARGLLSIQCGLFHSEIQTEIRGRMLRTAFALERHKLENKSYPESIESLKLKPLEPEIVIEYQRTDKGYVLQHGDMKFER